MKKYLHKKDCICDCHCSGATYCPKCSEEMSSETPILRSDLRKAYAQGLKSMSENYEKHIIPGYVDEIVEKLYLKEDQLDELSKFTILATLEDIFKVKL